MTESLLLTTHIVSSYVLIILMYNLFIHLYFNFVLKLNAIGIIGLCFVLVFNIVLMWFMCCTFCAGFPASS
jgi:hypothetical protein